MLSFRNDGSTDSEFFYIYIERQVPLCIGVKKKTVERNLTRWIRKLSSAFRNFYFLREQLKMVQDLIEAHMAG